MVADIYELAGRFREEGGRIAADVGQTQPRWQLMSVVLERPLTVPQAARRLGLSRQAVQRTANEIVDAGLADLVDNPDHRVSKLLELTADGRDTLVRIMARAEEFNARVASALDPDDLATMRRSMSMLLAAIRD